MNAEEEALQVVKTAHLEYSLECEKVQKANALYRASLEAHKWDWSHPEVIAALDALVEARKAASIAYSSFLAALAAWERACASEIRF